MFIILCYLDTFFLGLHPPKSVSSYILYDNYLILDFPCGNLQPPKIKAFIDRVIKSPLCDIAIPLSGFRWEYSKVIT